MKKTILVPLILSLFLFFNPVNSADFLEPTAIKESDLYTYSVIYNYNQFASIGEEHSYCKRTDETALSDYLKVAVQPTDYDYKLIDVKTSNELSVVDSVKDKTNEIKIRYEYSRYVDSKSHTILEECWYWTRDRMETVDIQKCIKDVCMVLEADWSPTELYFHNSDNNIYVEGINTTNIMLQMDYTSTYAKTLELSIEWDNGTIMTDWFVVDNITFLESDTDIDMVGSAGLERKEEPLVMDFVYNISGISVPPNPDFRNYDVAGMWDVYCNSSGYYYDQDAWIGLAADNVVGHWVFDLPTVNDGLYNLTNGNYYLDTRASAGGINGSADGVNYNECPAGGYWCSFNQTFAITNGNMTFYTSAQGSNDYLDSMRVKTQNDWDNLTYILTLTDYITTSGNYKIRLKATNSSYNGINTTVTHSFALVLSPPETCTFMYPQIFPEGIGYLTNYPFVNVTASDSGVGIDVVNLTLIGTTSTIGNRTCSLQDGWYINDSYTVNDDYTLCAFCIDNAGQINSTCMDFSLKWYGMDEGQNTTLYEIQTGLNITQEIWDYMMQNYNLLNQTTTCPSGPDIANWVWNGTNANQTTLHFNSIQINQTTWQMNFTLFEMNTTLGDVLILVTEINDTAFWLNISIVGMNDTINYINATMLTACPDCGHVSTGNLDWFDGGATFDPESLAVYYVQRQTEWMIIAFVCLGMFIFMLVIYLYPKLKKKGKKYELE